MKKLTAVVLGLCLTLCGCNNSPITEIQIVQTVAGEDVIIETPDSMYLGDTVYAIATCPVSSSAIDDKGHAIFTQSYQKFRFYLDNNNVQRAIEEDLQQRLNLFFADAATIQSQARQDCFKTEDWVPYYSSICYTPRRVDSTVISLSAVHNSYGGTAPVQSVSCVTYDTTSGAVLYLADVLEPTCTGDVLAQLICRELKGADNLYDEYEETVTDIFSAGLSGYSGWYLDSQGLCIPFSPYEINPSGALAVIPYSALAGVLQDAYFPAQSTATGSLVAEMYQGGTAERFSFIADVSLDTEGSPIVIYPSETVNHLRVEAGVLSGDDAQFTPTATVFACDSFYLGNALIITTKLSEDAPALRVSYYSGGQWVSASVLYYAENNSILLAYG